ncbi:hypothetical protein IHQ71_29960 (plasmid) [Rhizobium sp. TH2]|uniref:hypothetical protein n=1 Tax=Rhizobium sp. TH2 TaxID=2775403 RepID=UPI002157097B|nr:hypothetical protein [Rhizobium sp. TH2]UVC12478.1 hypothetical protein IHQ71_29960 [Rhizobium sp. TH2]
MGFDPEVQTFFGRRQDRSRFAKIENFVSTDGGDRAAIFAGSGAHLLQDAFRTPDRHERFRDVFAHWDTSMT